nr:MAG TPA: hypothetical protein [Caudoviricetes sp.]
MRIRKNNKLLYERSVRLWKYLMPTIYPSILSGRILSHNRKGY